MRTWLLIALGALASIADEPGTWVIPSEQALPAGTLDDQHTELRYLVHVEWINGPTGIFGEAHIRLDATGQTQPPQPLNVTIFATNLADPTVTHSAVAPIEVGNTTSATVDVDGWRECHTMPCSEDYELRIARPGVTGMVVDVGGLFVLSTSGSNPEPKDAQAIITVMGPMP